MSKIKRQVVLAKITAVPFNKGTLDNIVRALLKEAKAKGDSLIIVLTGASDIQQFNTKVKAAEGLVAGIREELPASFELEVAYYLASQGLTASVQRQGGKALVVRSDDGGLVSFGDKPSVDVQALMALMVSGYAIVMIPPICSQTSGVTMSINTFAGFLARQLGTSVIDY